MIKKIIGSFLISLLAVSPVYSTQIFSMKELAEEIEKSDEKTLVVFDVDEVLITTKDHFIHPYADDFFFPLVKQAMLKATTEEEKKDLQEKLSLSMLLPERVLIEKEMPSLIKTLQEKGVKVIALTSCPTGTFGVIPQVERWRIEHLKSLDISFRSSFPKIERYFLTEIKKEGTPAPLFEEGVLFSKGYKKGEVLKAFFKKGDFYPSKVIFIDDLQENLETVKAELESLNIPFQGYQYSGAERFFKTADKAILTYQFNHLMQTKEWLSDTEVEKRLKK